MHLLHYAFCGVFGEKEMIGVLKTVRGQCGTEVFLEYSLALAAALDYPSLLGFHDFLNRFSFSS